MTQVGRIAYYLGISMNYFISKISCIIQMIDEWTCHLRLYQ
uniref:Uncharacterized protein n=1 Tax=Arundo donax TaxID=35708 RepID=A0A0A8Z8G1_ARUDO